MTPGDLPKLPVERLAEFLLGCAKEDPALLARSHSESIGGQDLRARLSRPRPIEAVRSRLPEAIPLPLRLAGSRADPEIEELVAIAVACSRRAEDALQHARDVSWMARRRMSMVAGATAIGVLAAAVAIILDRHGSIANPGLASVASAASGVIDQGRQTVRQLADARSGMAVPPDTAAAGSSVVSPGTQTPARADVVPLPQSVASGPAAPPIERAAARSEKSAPLNTAASDPSTATPGTPPTRRSDQTAPRETMATGWHPSPVVPAAPPARTDIASPRDLGGSDPSPAAVLPPVAAPAPADATVPRTSVMASRSDPGQAPVQVGIRAEPSVTPEDARADTTPISEPAATPGPPAATLPPLQPRQSASQARRGAKMPRPRVYYATHYYRPVARRAPPRQQFVLTGVFEGVRRNIHAIFH